MKNKKKNIALRLVILMVLFFQYSSSISFAQTFGGPGDYNPTTGTMQPTPAATSNITTVNPNSTAAGTSGPYKNQEKIPGAQPTSEFIPYLKSIINFGFAIIGILALFMLIIGAYQYLMAAGSGNASDAKDTITSALLGLILGLTAWIILAKINPDLVKMNPIKQIVGIGGGQSPQTGNPQNNNPAQPYTGPKGSGDCSPNQGACNQENTACFGNYQQAASQICGLESAGGQPNIPSGTDKCQDGSVFSQGLWQINMISHGDEFGCGDIFAGNTKGTCLNRRSDNICLQWSCSVVPGQQAKYDACKQKLYDPKLNTELACKMFWANEKNGRVFSDWANTKKKCGV